MQPYAVTQDVLRTDVAGMPLEWIDYRDAVRLYHMARVAYTCGSPIYRVRGGWNAKTGLRSVVEVNSIIATEGDPGLRERGDAFTPPLNNRTLFKRDANLCMYCAQQFQTRDLTRDHITPLSQGGRDVWTNVVTACRRCNNHKGGRTPEQAGVKAHCSAVHAHLRGVHLPEGAARAGGPDGVPAHALSANVAAARAIAGAS